MRDTTDFGETHVITRPKLFVAPDTGTRISQDLTQCLCTEDDCECTAGTVVGTVHPARRDRLATEIARLSKIPNGQPKTDPLTVRWFGVVCETWVEGPRWDLVRHFRPVRVLGNWGPLPTIPVRSIPAHLFEE